MSSKTNTGKEESLLPLVTQPVTTSMERDREGTLVGNHGHNINHNNNDDHFRGDFSMEDSPSYEILQNHNMLTRKYRVPSEDALFLIHANSSRWCNTVLCLTCCPLCMCNVFKGFEVPSGSIRMGYDGRGGYDFFGHGVHRVIDPFYSVLSGIIPLTQKVITHGDRTIVTVDQGFIGYCMERGQPVLLPPGMHQWKSGTLKFERLIDLNQPVIELGPWTLLTIDQGYMAVTQDNGKQVILDGGSVYLLTHRNWKFEKFISTKIQTDELKRIEAASADNVIMLVDATVLWRISDVETAVLVSAETMTSDGGSSTQTIVKLRRDVLKQAEASLAYFVGTINFSDSMAAAAINQRSREHAVAAAFASPVETTPFQAGSAPNAHPQGSSAAAAAAAAASSQTPMIELNLYNAEKLKDAMSHANKITHTYGVEIMAINIISAIPADKKLQQSLAAGAVAAAEAQMMETTAQGKGRAVQIEAKADAEKIMILAKAAADADKIKADGALAAANLLSSNPVSVELAKIDRTGDAISGKGNHASFFFGSNPQDMQSLLANSSIIPGNSTSNNS